MTGGQMAPTSLPGQVTQTSPQAEIPIRPAIPSGSAKCWQRLTAAIYRACSRKQCKEHPIG